MTKLSVRWAMVVAASALLFGLAGSPAEAQTRVGPGQKKVAACVKKAIGREKVCANAKSRRAKEACLARVVKRCDRRPNRRKLVVAKPKGAQALRTSPGRPVSGASSFSNGGGAQQLSCKKCTAVCQTVSWFSGASSFHDQELGGGMSPSKCIDQAVATCEAGYSRWLAKATCSN